MIKKLFYIIIAFLSMNYTNVFANNSPVINCDGLPGCGRNGRNMNNAVEKISANIITETIKYVAVFAVLALMISGVMYMVSGGEEEKTKKAKSWIIWSLVGVFLSISSYYIISTIANINIKI